MSELSTEMDHAAGMKKIAEQADGVQESPDVQIRPDDPPVPPIEWAKDNLFSSPFNGFLTIAATIFGAWAIRSLLGFTFAPERNWASVATNMRLFLVKAYPLENQDRIWVSLGIVLLLAGMSVGLYKSGGMVPRTRPVKLLRSFGMVVFIGSLLAPVSLGSKAGFLVAGVVIVAAGQGLLVAMGDKGRKTFLPGPYIVWAVLGIITLSLWVIPYGNYMFFLDESRVPVFIAESGKVLPMSTKLPWTIMYLVLVGSYFVGRIIANTVVGRNIRKLLPMLWILSPFIVTWLVMRKPEMDWNHVWSTDIPMFLGFAVGGGAILFALTKPGIGETGRLIAVALTALALATWLFAFFGWPILWPMLQKARISFLFLGLAALAAPNFAGETKKRLNYAFAWAGFMAVFHLLATLMNADSGLVTQETFFYGGWTLTLFVAILTLMASFPVGIMMALARTSKLPIFRVLSTGYIEIIRGVPLITILFFFTIGFSLFLPEGMAVSGVAAAVLGYSLFSAAYLAENIRGGLQSIPKGQFEAADAIGLTTVQRTGLVVLPQALRASIPPLVGQVIGTYKETSLLAIVGLFDLLRIADKVVPAQTEFIGHKKESLLFVCFIYWIVAYSMSRYSRSLETRLGVGTR